MSLEQDARWYADRVANEDEEGHEYFTRENVEAAVLAGFERGARVGAR